MIYLIAFMIGFIISMFLYKLFNNNDIYKNASYNYDVLFDDKFIIYTQEIKQSKFSDYYDTNKVLSEFEIKFKERNIPYSDWYKRMVMYCSFVSPYFRNDKAFDIEVNNGHI